MKKTSKFLLLITAAVLLPAVSWADIMFSLGNNPQPGEENVLLNKGTTGSTVQGTTNQSGVVVNFTSGTQLLTEPANGQARIEATNGSSQVALSDISLSLANGTFTDAIFNPAIVGTIGSPGDATVTVLAHLMAIPETITFTYSLGNGNNFLTIVALNGEVIDSISLSAISGFGFSDLRQVRISGVGAVIVPDSGTTLTLLGASILAVALLRPAARAKFGKA